MGVSPREHRFQERGKYRGQGVLHRSEFGGIKHRGR
jgi:hypothetical protein